MKILLVEDDAELCSVIQNALEKEKYIVDCVSDGETAMFYALNTEYAYDLAIIDRMLPVIDGLTIIKAMRKKGIRIPVIIITAMDALDNRIEGLDGGADDYLVKPFHIRELSARVRALIRRPADLQLSGKLQYGDLTFDKENRKLSSDGKSVQLTARETELFSVLIQSPEKLFNREQLVLKIWGTSSEVEAGNVDNYISFLRKRLRELNSFCKITTVYGAGYKLEKNHAE
ncbi:MAG TPA: response regulator transcription factor [Candidatus Mediterraneibacter norwichensis]|nr:response regulator transcription factor [Candidatus Mediterraneibacter norwichensis]